MARKLSEVLAALVADLKYERGDVEAVEKIGCPCCAPYSSTEFYRTPHGEYVKWEAIVPILEKHFKLTIP